MIKKCINCGRDITDTTQGIQWEFVWVHVDTKDMACYPMTEADPGSE